MPCHSADLIPMDPAPVTGAAASEMIAWSARNLCAALATITFPVVALDQLSKFYVAGRLPFHETWTVIPNWLDLPYTLNPGAAFSLFSTMPSAIRDIFFLALSSIATVVLMILIAREGTSVSSRNGLALILGGTLGNFIDRLVRGRVIDFIYFHHGAFSYPVFNLADSAITVGVATIMVVSLLESRTRDALTAKH